jgi:hypothetical protein
MSTRPPGDGSTGTIRDVDLPGRAVTALTRAGVTSIDDLAVLTRRELAAIPGLGPGMIAAIRLVVPEPPRGRARPAAAPGPARVPAPADPEPGPADEPSPAAPAIPSFDSLRATPRRSAADVLFLPPPPAPPPPAAAPQPPPPAVPSGTGTAGAPRPAEYADLLRLAMWTVRAVVGVPGRLVSWSVRAPVRCLRRLVGDGAGTGSPTQG